MEITNGNEEAMQQNANNDQIINNVLVHLYHSVVVGALDSIALVLRMKFLNETTNPRHKDLKGLYESLGPDRRRLFYDSVASIAEFAVYGTLDFVERYNRFEAESNRNEYPRLSLVYEHVVGKDVNQKVISQFGSVELGQIFKQIARDDQIRSLVDETITNILDSSAHE